MRQRAQAEIGEGGLPGRMMLVARGRCGRHDTASRIVSDDRGSVTVVVVGMIGVLVGLCVALAAYAQVATDSERVRLAADQSALAGASVVLGAVTTGLGACELAAATAERNGASLVSCRELSTGVQVIAQRPSIWSYTVDATARAGAAQGEEPSAGQRASSQREFSSSGSEKGAGGVG